MEFAKDILSNVIAGFFGSGLVVIFTVFIMQHLKGRFKGWKVVVVDAEKELCARPVGQKKAEAVLDDSTELAVLVKGVASPYGWLTLDPVSAKAMEVGLFRVDVSAKAFIVDMSKNPPAPKKPSGN